MTQQNWFKGIVVTLALLGVALLLSGGWHLYTDHRNFDKIVVWVYQKQQQEAAAAQRQQRQQAAQQQAPAPPTVTPPQPEK